MNTPYITNIQRSCLHDGPGIRTTIFIKGCNLRCPWCCNVECINLLPELYFLKEKCLRNKNINCKECLDNSVKSPDDYLKIKINEKNFLHFEKLFKRCPVRCIGIYGRNYIIDEIINIIIKDKEYFQVSNGGVTFSGGEPLLFDLRTVYERVKMNDIEIAVETSLFVPFEMLKICHNYVDLYIVDIKILDYNLCQKIIGGDIKIYFQNVEFLISNKLKAIFRYPVVPTFTDSLNNIKLLVKFLLDYEIPYLEIFSVHNLGELKYKSLGKKYQSYNLLNFEKLNEIKNFIEMNTNTKVEILYL